ncbi:NXPE family member 3-like [Branchiostoma lanceolatum]|uniref:NXPE family member 3-like n=1 Tax=Branchiostoma lanceolatum TaxID=7740 RepID=UPI0034556D10
MLHVVISAKDDRNRTVTNIGDFFRASILTREEEGGEQTGRKKEIGGSGAVGIITDHQNGTYTATFRLLWEGEVTIRIQLVHPRQAIDFIERNIRRYPIDLVAFQKRYVVGHGTVDTQCNVDPVIFKNTSAVWRDPLVNRRRCVRGLATQQISGFYRNGVWNSLVCKNRHFSSQAGWQQCLKGKTMHFMGDSTIRQWWEHLVRILKMTETHIPEAKHSTGPLLAQDPVHNITVNFRIHGPPLRAEWTRTFHIKYVVNAIDEIEGGPSDVVGLTIWAHFTSYPVEVYKQRMEAVRAAIERLLHRSPETLVVIKSANTRMGNSLISGYWLAYKLDLMMREMFRGIDVVLVDAWEMTNAQHWHGDAIHPAEDIVVQELEFLCSFICPL